MKYIFLLTASLATLVNSAPVDDKATLGDGSVDYGSYGAYGAYGSYGQYDASVGTESQSMAASDAPADAPVAVQNAAPNHFVAVTTRSGDANVHLQPISANGQRFFIGKDTATYCPLSDCSSYVNFTVFLARPYDANSGLGLYTNVAGGQAAFVTKEGELGYTQAHSGSSPSGSLNNPFQYTPGTDPDTTGTLSFNSKGFVACPVADQADVYQIYAVGAPNFSKPDCIGVGITTSTYTGSPAYQYN
ncbi:hypothetical protein EV44_g0606 [Erysiphe necator]|uniref:Secreted protein n=1 Tax=Uncinula necator TaxID=52586 RepID=A0A0B1P997_UNCNE|nr:hypothetical protein EV44_g0606 [Erysiphe necator]